MTVGVIQKLRDGLAWGQEAQRIINYGLQRLNLIAPSGIPSAVTDASYTLRLTDAFQKLTFNSSSAQTVTIPTHANVAFEIGTIIKCLRLGTGLVTFSPDTGVTLRKPTGIRPNRFMGVRVAKSANQTTADYTTQTAVTWDAEDYDTDGFHDTSTNTDRLTIPANFGIKRVTLSANVAAQLNTADTWSSIELTKNAAVFHGEPSQRFDGETTHLITTGAAGVDCTDGDIFRMLYQTESDNSITIAAAITSFALEVTTIDAQGTIAYQYGEIELLKIGTNEWAITGPGLG